MYSLLPAPVCSSSTYLCLQEQYRTMSDHSEDKGLKCFLCIVCEIVSYVCDGDVQHDVFYQSSCLVVIMQRHTHFTTMVKTLAKFQKETTFGYFLSIERLRKPFMPYRTLRVTSLCMVLQRCWTCLWPLMVVRVSQSAYSMYQPTHWCPISDMRGKAIIYI